ncbi:MAG TPA: Gfo/Idh/MocA family oxidoreductase, partial [Candidatus Dormibacteraeota bacterium]|nr:Gfo/Idh/MocA family oxidoreductase [Candidatus Dormibacteraeota bacterium]
MALRVGLLGYGLAGSVFHAPLITATPGLALISIVTGHPERQASVRKVYPQARVYESTEAFWAASAEHDLAVIATPTGSHVTLGLAAIEAGLPAVIDKPVASTASEARRLAAAAAARGTWLSVFHNRRWDGETLTARKLLDEGLLGTPQRLESRFERWRPQPNAAAWRESTPPEGGGGILLDLGSHLVDQAMFLFGRPRSVYAEVEQRRPGNAAEDDVFIALEHAGGVRSHLWSSAVAAHLGPSLRLLG